MQEGIKLGAEKQEELKRNEVPVIQESPEELMQRSENEVRGFETDGLQKSEKMAGEAGLEVDEGTRQDLMHEAQEAQVAKEELIAEIADNQGLEPVDRNDKSTSQTDGETYIPFRGIRKVESEHAGLYEIDEDPKFVMRKEKFNLEGITLDGLTTQKTTEQLVKTRAMFSRLREKYGVPVVQFSYVIGEDPKRRGVPALHTFEEKVKGDSLEKIETFERDDLGKIDKAYVGILNQLSDSFESGEPFWLDAEQSQFILGTREGETERQPFVADLEPRITYFKNLKKSGASFIGTCL